MPTASSKDEIKAEQLYDTFIEYANMFWFQMRIATNTRDL